MLAIDMKTINALTAYAQRIQTAPAPKRVPSVLSTYAHFLDVMLTRANIVKDARKIVRAARLGAYRRRAKPYTLGQVRAHVKYRASHQPEIYSGYAKAARML